MRIKERAVSLFPYGTKRNKLARKAYRLVSPKTESSESSISYEEWIKKSEPKLWVDNKAINKDILISIIVPCYNTPDKYILPLINSLKDQTYPNWQLCLVDGSTDNESKNKLKKTAYDDKRIKYINAKTNLGIVGNTNLGITEATGDFIGFLDHDDTLSIHALMEVAHVIAENPNVDLIYSDEDKLSDDGKHRLLPFFKPDWSPELLLGVNYITHFVVARRTLIKEICGLREGFDGAQDYDFLLRLTEKTDKILHIPKILYHWRLAEGSTSKNVNEKNYADTAGQRSLKDAVKRRQLKATVIEILDRPTNYRLQFQLLDKQPKVSIIIPFKDKPELLQQCVGSILNKSTYKNYELILISNNSIENATHNYLAGLKSDNKCKIYKWDHPFNYSAINNFGRTKSGGEYLILLNNDTEVITADWIEELIGVASQKDVGAVGPLLLYPGKTIQHAGIILGMGGMAGHAFRFRRRNEWTNFGLTSWPRNYLAVTGACLAVQAKKFDEVRGFDEDLQIGGGDVALCLSLHKKGWRNVFWPFAELIHHENMTVGPYDKNVPISDYNRSLDYYREFLDNGDPYFNKNLSLDDEYISLRKSP